MKRAIIFHCSTQTPLPLRVLLGLVGRMEKALVLRQGLFALGAAATRRTALRPSPVTMGAKRMAVTRTHFTFRVDMWDRDGLGVIEHIAGAQDYQVAMATYVAARQRWPDAFITLRQGARVIEESRKMSGHAAAAQR